MTVSEGVGGRVGPRTGNPSEQEFMLGFVVGEMAEEVTEPKYNGLPISLENQRIGRYV